MLKKLNDVLYTLPSASYCRASLRLSRSQRGSRNFIVYCTRNVSSDTAVRKQDDIHDERFVGCFSLWIV